jgi:hypothetical protein
MDLRSLQKPLKEQYRADPATSKITLRAKGAQTDAPVSCSVDLGRAIYKAEAHKGVGGAGAGACSGDLLLGAKDVPVGFETIRLRFDIVAPKATPEQISAMREKTEQYCVVMQTLLHQPKIRSAWIRQD